MYKVLNKFIMPSYEDVCSITIIVIIIMIVIYFEYNYNNDKSILYTL